jgi:hypothetical protein
MRVNFSGIVKGGRSSLFRAGKPLDRGFSRLLRAEALTWGLGLCPNLSLLLRAAAGGAQKERKEVFRGHPEPRQRAAALCNPAEKR